MWFLKKCETKYLIVAPFKENINLIVPSHVTSIIFEALSLMFEVSFVSSISPFILIYGCVFLLLYNLIVASNYFIPSLYLPLSSIVLYFQHFYMVCCQFFKHIPKASYMAFLGFLLEQLVGFV